MNDKDTNVEELKLIVRDFCDARNWRQFHDAKELAIGISTEAGELLDHFRFKSKEEIEGLFKDQSRRTEIAHELADVLYFVLRFADTQEIDLTEALKEKMKVNEKKYPVEKAKNNNKKYSEY